jgi:hypothetical protein
MKQPAKGASNVQKAKIGTTIQRSDETDFSSSGQHKKPSQSRLHEIPAISGETRGKRPATQNSVIVS